MIEPKCVRMRCELQSSVLLQQNHSYVCFFAEATYVPIFAHTRVHNILLLLYMNTHLVNKLQVSCTHSSINVPMWLLTVSIHVHFRRHTYIRARIRETRLPCWLVETGKNHRHIHNAHIRTNMCVVCVCVCTHMYTHRKREREREHAREIRARAHTHTHTRTHTRHIPTRYGCHAGSWRQIQSTIGLCGATKLHVLASERLSKNLCVWISAASIPPRNN
jgi:hypothetical protein